MTDREKIIKILNNIKPAVDFTSVNTIVDEGYMDSLEFISFVTELKNTFGINIGFDDLIPENFNSIEAILQFVNKCKG